MVEQESRRNLEGAREYSVREMKKNGMSSSVARTSTGGQKDIQQPGK